MKKMFLMVVILLMLATGCSSTKNNNLEKSKDKKVNNIINLDEVGTVKAIINGEEYTIILENNATTKAFVNMLPKELNMNELNGNEKYVYLDNTLPTNLYSPKKINAGDVMLYGNNCLVLFYKSFNTSYNYTKIGHIDNLPDLGNSDITIRFEK